MGRQLKQSIDDEAVFKVIAEHGPIGIDGLSRIVLGARGRAPKAMLKAVHRLVNAGRVSTIFVHAGRYYQYGLREPGAVFREPQ